MRNQMTQKTANEIYRMVTRKYANWVRNLNVTIDGEQSVPEENGKIKILKRGTITVSGIVKNIQMRVKITDLVKFKADGRTIVNNLRVG